MPSARTDAERLSAALEATEFALREVLAAEAQRSVDAAVRRLEAQAGPVRLKDVEVEVIIKKASLETRHAHKPAASRRRGPAPKPAAGKRAKGRPAGQIRTALLDAFSGGSAQLDTEALRGHLHSRGLDPTSDNLHQHLRRLVKAGTLERAGRGLYRRAG